MGTEWLSAGINLKGEFDNMYTDGGRVFSIIGKGNDTTKARMKALKGMACCSIEDNGLHYRTDIAWRDIAREEKQGNK